jgi:hypothetical protein
VAHGVNPNIRSYYDGNYTYMRLSNREHEVLTDFIYQKYLFKIDEVYDLSSSTNQVDVFKLELFIEDFKTYIFSLSKEPVTKESLTILENITENSYDKIDWFIEIFVSNDIFSKVFERYFKLIDSLSSGAYVWEYFKTPLSLDFISNNIIESELNRKLLAGSEFNQSIDLSLWLSLFLNSVGYYINKDKHLNIKYSFPENPNFQNCLRFIDKFKDEVDWSVIQAYYPGKFSMSFIDKYKDYLLFHNYINRKGQCFRGCDYRLDSNGLKGLEYSIDLGNVSLSSLQRVEWSSELLFKFQEYFSWDDLSDNENLPWSLELIMAFEEKWNWKKLSENNGIRFSSEILNKFKSKINYETLSKNKNVEWLGLSLYGADKNKLDWNVLSDNPSIDVSFINKYSDKIIFSESKDGFNWNFHYHFGGTSGNYVPRRSLSSNAGFVWTDTFIQDHLKEIDFWLIALFGKITPELVIKYAAFFDESREISTSWKKNSDWPTIKVHYFCSGWQNLKKNKNFIPSEDFLTFSKNREIRVYKPYEDEGHNTNYISGFIDPNKSSDFRVMSVYDLFKS